MIVSTMWFSVTFETHCSIFSIMSDSHLYEISMSCVILREKKLTQANDYNSFEKLWVLNQFKSDEQNMCWQINVGITPHNILCMTMPKASENKFTGYNCKKCVFKLSGETLLTI